MTECVVCPRRDDMCALISYLSVERFYSYFYFILYFLLSSVYCAFIIVYLPQV